MMNSLLCSMSKMQSLRRNCRAAKGRSSFALQLRMVGSCPSFSPFRQESSDFTNRRTKGEVGRPAEKAVRRDSVFGLIHKGYPRASESNSAKWETQRSLDQAQAPPGTGIVIGGYTEPDGARKHFGALPAGVNEEKRLKFASRVGTGFSEKLLRDLSSELNKIRVDACPLFNLPAAGRSRWDQGLTAAEMRRCHWVKPVMVCQIKFTEWTRDDCLHQPVFLGIREEKNAKGSGAGEGELILRFGAGINSRSIFFDFGPVLLLALLVGVAGDRMIAIRIFQPRSFTLSFPSRSLEVFAHGLRQVSIAIDWCILGAFSFEQFAITHRRLQMRHLCGSGIWIPGRRSDWLINDEMIFRERSTKNLICIRQKRQRPVPS